MRAESWKWESRLPIPSGPCNRVLHEAPHLSRQKQAFVVQGGGNAAKYRYPMDCKSRISQHPGPEALEVEALRGSALRKQFVTDGSI